jgi:hypothetical protein
MTLTEAVEQFRQKRQDHAAAGIRERETSAAWTAAKKDLETARDEENRAATAVWDIVAENLPDSPRW